MDYLEFLYYGNGNISRIFDVCRAFYCSEKQDRSLTDFFMDYKKTYEELNVLLPFSLDVKVQKDQREKMTVMGFLATLPSVYDYVKTQILCSKFLLSKKRSVEYFAQKYPYMLYHLPR